jgi:chemotaxis protein CheX
VSTLSQAEIKVITDAAQSYFGRLTREAARVSASFLADPGQLPEFDYTGLIRISGTYRGCVYFTAPKMMMRFLLLSVGETMQGDDIFMDAAGEIANTIAGNARKHFGEKMEISVPTTMKASTLTDLSKTGNGPVLRQRPMVIRIQWQTLAAALVVDLESASA